MVVDRARLWTLPEQPPPLIGAAVSEATARWAGSWADGLATVNAPAEHLRRMIDAYRSAGAEGPLILQVHPSWAATEDEALRIAHDQWRTDVFAPPSSASERSSSSRPVNRRCSRTAATVRREGVRLPP